MICGTDPRPPGSALSGGSRLRDSFCISWLLSSLLVVGPLVSMLQATPPPPPGKLIQSYALVSANDFPQRDPLDWRLLASNDGGKTWRTLDSRKNELFSERHQRRVLTKFLMAAWKPNGWIVQRIESPAPVGFSGSIAHRPIHWSRTSASCWLCERGPETVIVCGSKGSPPGAQIRQTSCS